MVVSIRDTHSLPLPRTTSANGASWASQASRLPLMAVWGLHCRPMRPDNYLGVVGNRGIGDIPNLCNDEKLGQPRPAVVYCLVHIDGENALSPVL